MPLLESLRKELFLAQDEILPNRCFANYFESNPSFSKLNEISNVLMGRIDELKLIAIQAKTADYYLLRQISKRLHLGYRKVRKLSGKSFRLAYESNSNGELLFFREFFSE